jgi:hypothetical protein
MILIGSAALSCLGLCDREPRDVDVICTFDDVSRIASTLRELKGEATVIPLSENKSIIRAKDLIYECEIAWTGSSGHDLLVGAWKRGLELVDFRGYRDDMLFVIPTLDVLYTLKMSHRYRKNSPHFWKTRSDIMSMRALGAKVFDQEWLKKREAETYSYSHPKLNVMKDSFFSGDGVTYVYDHDDIHKVMAHLLTDGQKVPAYELYKVPGEEVRCSKDMFFSLPEEARLYGVLEEAQVLALERSQIPFRGKVDPRRSFDYALMKVASSITSGWFREFAWENLHVVQSMYEDDYADRFWKAVTAGQVRRVDR